MRVQLCGPTVIERGPERLESGLPGRQGRMLFAYLVLNRHRLTSRDELVEAVWPRELPAATDAGLNALLSKLRKLLGPDALEGRSSIRLRLGEARIDLEVAVEAAARAESQVALKAWKLAWGPALAALFTAEREFLPGEDAPWIDEQRRVLAELRLRALEAYALPRHWGVGETELTAAARAARQLVRLAPLRESGYQLLMEALARQGNAAEALRVYSEICTVLRDELGASPCAATQAVYAEILRA